ncbi:hypothetical protein HZH66_011858 [Vespula vulgaris]|uniref:Uncharacterized protein n=1 Tax=Vespula vulgaris TaxID=7454 RepID=A0A834JCL2_VESVU|nr:hypothetical protein HZH66_011858 [Vespula vulgaris]
MDLVTTRKTRISRIAFDSIVKTVERFWRNHPSSAFTKAAVAVTGGGGSSGGGGGGGGSGGTDDGTGVGTVAVAANSIVVTLSFSLVQ